MPKKRLSEYEVKRLARIEENKEVLKKLEIKKLPAPEKKKKEKREKHSEEPSAPARTSRRLAGDQPEIVEPKEVREKYSNLDPEQRQAREEDLLHEVIAKWKTKESPPEEPGSALFLIPTGLEGVNDHTLTEIVPKLGSYLWGFALGLYSRIFIHMKPGDRMLFTSSGSGKFNLIGVVGETRVVSQAECDEFWSRMRYQMGGGVKTNVGFPLLVLMHTKPIPIDWPKNEVMRLCGYTDRLQSSRRIVLEGNNGAHTVVQRCKETLAALEKK